MGRTFTLAGLVAAGVGVGAVLGAAAAGNPTRPRDWLDVADVVLRVATLGVFLVGLLGTFAVLTSLRSSVYSQMYGRFQTLLLKLADRPDLFDRLKRDTYTAADDDPDDLAAPTHGHRFVANVMINMYEEAFLLYDSRVVAVIDTMTADYWESMLGSMRAAFRLRYVRTHWERRQAMYSPRFNRFVREVVLAADPG